MNSMKINNDDLTSDETNEATKSVEQENRLTPKHIGLIAFLALAVIGSVLRFGRAEK